MWYGGALAGLIGPTFTVLAGGTESDLSEPKTVPGVYTL